jgi:uncharacterized protein (TIGR00661 family)
MNPTKHFLICPLNWGLGHASRCIPIIRQLLSFEQKVSIAGDGLSLELLKKEFPTADFYNLPSYNIQYKYPSMALNMVLQSRKLFNAIRAERKHVELLVKNENIDVIISDNRFGCRSSNIPSIYITHQSSIEAGGIVSSLFATRIHKSWFSKFDECWIPDFDNENNLAGNLSAPPRGIKSLYIGPLSRFKYESSTSAIKYNGLFILSGPEPQRSYLEAKICSQLSTVAGKFLMVRGTYTPLKSALPPNVECIDLADSSTLYTLKQSSNLLISRSGYSSIMDLFFTQKKALLIPTPGQSEQEYLAEYHMDKKHFLSVRQSALDLKTQLKEAQQYKGFQPMEMQDLLTPALKKWINY